MQSSLQQNINTKNLQKSPKESSSTTTITTNSTDNSTNTEVIKKKRKRNRKKNKSNQVVEKVENLISKTFQARLEAENNKIKLNEEKTESVSNMNNEQNPKITKLQNPVRNPLSQSKKSSPPSNQNPIQKQDDKSMAESKKIIKQSGVSAPETIAQKTEKSREEIVAEREAKKLAKQLAKNKNQSEKTAPNISASTNTPGATEPNPEKLEKSRENILAEREAKKLAKQLTKKGKPENSIDSVDCAAKIVTDVELKKLTNTMNNIHITENTEKKILSKAERRAIQETQRAAKAKLLADKQIPKKTADAVVKPVGSGNFLSPLGKGMKIGDAKNLNKPQDIINNFSNECKVKLFNHLDYNIREKNLFINNSHIHPAMVRLGEQFSTRTIVGSNARCVAFLNALKTIIQDYETPPKKEFTRGLESIIKNCVDHLHQCRPLAVSISNAHKNIKFVLTQLKTDQPESELKEKLCTIIDTYIKDQIEKAALAISTSVQEKISNGDVILTFGCSSLINHILQEAHTRKIDFRVIVVDSRPFNEGQELLRRLVTKEIPCTYVLINAVGFIMPEVTKVLLGAHSLLANGYVMARTGTAQVALVARSFNVPVLVCCETHKFSERVQTDAIVYNELGNPHDLVISKQCKLSNWQNSNHKLSPLNLNFDITPPELVTAVVTEVAILPCTSVPVILRVKPTEIGY